MKIAIFTYWTSSDNYGQLLQCYALQKYLRDKGYEAYLVRYSPISQNIRHNPTIWNKLKNVKLKNLLPWVRKRLKAEIAYENHLRKLNKKLNLQRKFDEFRNSYLCVSEIIYHSIEELKANPPQADIYICGSDQVWHDSLLEPNVAGWYLQFGDSNIKRISYAASIGRNISLEEKDIFKTYLSKFDAISLREQNACNYVQNIGFTKAIVVADPTILLPIDEFTEIIPSVLPNSDSYILFYTLNIRTSKEICWEEIYPIIKEENLKVKSVCSSGYYPARNIIPDCDNIQATIPEWISLIKGAQYIVTTSFHGIVFCIKLHKPFIAIPLTNEYSKSNVRLTSLLDFVGLSSQMYSQTSNIRELLHAKISWDIVDLKMNELRQKGINFLNKELR